jgi:D-alanyl-lipoteichoic acid acyltransferase DltB (MBOAT superfamily)
MPFNSLKYFLFLPLVYLVFYFAGERARWCVLLAASLLFYAALNVPYLLAVLVLVAIVTYGFGICLDQAETAKAKRALLWGGITANVLILIVMKYLPFLSENLKVLSSLLSLDAHIHPVKAFVAIGVSYYVFQAISYLYDIYLEIEKPERHFGYFALYLVFFPKLLQGPLERAGDLIHQLKVIKVSDVSQFRCGLFLIVSGLFKKIIIADRLSLFVDPVYSNVNSFSGASLIITTYIYALQLYFDFSGYTDMALGSAKLFNINLTQNFNNPYFATSVAEFWRRWHISFSRWILDYIFKPLQMQWRNWKNWGTALALVVAFIISGIWHGASWGFVIWGGLHGMYMAFSVFYRPYQKKLHKSLRIEKTAILRVWQVFVTFNLVCFAWIFFRANSIDDACYIVSHLFSGITVSSNIVQLFPFVAYSRIALYEFVVVVISIGLLILITELAKRKSVIKCFYNKPFWMRCCFYYVIAMYMIIYGYFSSQSFSYVRF